jgi:hypothetical protein
MLEKKNKVRDMLPLPKTNPPNDGEQVDAVIKLEQDICLRDIDPTHGRQYLAVHVWWIRTRHRPDLRIPANRHVPRFRDELNHPVYLEIFREISPVVNLKKGNQRRTQSSIRDLSPEYLARESSERCDRDARRGIFEIFPIALRKGCEAI